MNSQRTPHITLYGNLGADPETRTLRGRTVTKEHYDIAKDEVVTQEHTTAEREIRTCRDRIAAETGKPPLYFAYPNGRPSDYTAETQQILRDHGFTMAFSTSEGIAGPDTDWMAVKRLPTAAAQIFDFAWAAAGLGRS